MIRRWFMEVLAVTLLATTSTAFAELSSPRSLMRDPTAWKTLASDGVKIQTSADRTAAGLPSLRIDFDFTAGAGYGGVFLDLPIDLPENFGFPLSVRGQGPANNLELKLVDPEGLNVWWINRRAFEWPAEPMRLANHRRHFQFAWGPSGGKPLTKLGRVELIIAANEGGRGTVWIDDLRLVELPLPKPYAGKAVFSTSSGEATPWLHVDFGEPREIGGLVVYWSKQLPPSDFDVEASDDGKAWTTLRRVRGAGGLPSEIALPDLQTRWLRFAFADGAAPGVERVEFLDTATGANPNALWRSRAARASRGIFPRTMLNAQSFWTIVGIPDDDREALINEEGQIEVDRRSFSIEPFLLRDGKLHTWADGTHEQSLRDGWMPIPTVIRRQDGLELSITALASGQPGASQLDVQYTIRNTSATPAIGQLFLAVRPIQVLPPWQDLNITGGWTPVRSIRAGADGLIVNDAKRVYASRGFRAAAATYDAGDIVEMLSIGRQPTEKSVECPQRSASGMIAWDFVLMPGESTARVITVPFQKQESAARPRDAKEFEALAANVAAHWSARVERVKFTLPESARQFYDTIRATQAYILVNHDGKGFQPGSRTYERSWIRDGSMTSAAMLEFGHDDLVKRFVAWYAPYQFPSGKVPCVVDRRGADPVPENDSHGQLLWLIANTHRYTGDIELVRQNFARVKLAVEYIESLRAQRMTSDFAADGKAHQEPNKPPVPALAFCGLVPESISHEGYSAKPMHSFWDQLYVLRGLNDAVYLADVAGEKELAEQWQKLADDFRASVIESIRLTQQAHGIDYLPGCVELGDFDSTSSTILLWPVGEAAKFPRAWIDATFDRYWSEFNRRRESTTWEAYTPYELRHVGAYVRLGHKDRAWAVLNWLMEHQRPAGWRHWAEVVWRERNTPRMIGDMPHTWCGSDFLNAARAMFVYEDEPTQRLVVFGAIPDDWFADKDGVSFEGLRTEYGAIHASAKMNGPDRLSIRIDGSAKPPGGFDIPSPLNRAIKTARLNGAAVSVEKNRIHFTSIPATIDLEY